MALPAATQAAVVTLHFGEAGHSRQVERRTVLAMGVKELDEGVRRRKALHHRIEKASVAEVVEASGTRQDAASPARGVLQRRHRRRTRHRKVFFDRRGDRRRRRRDTLRRGHPLDVVDGFVQLFVAVDVKLGLALEAPEGPGVHVEDDAVKVGPGIQNGKGEVIARLC